MENRKSQNEVVKRLIQQTITSMGDVSPDALPHLLKNRLQQQVSGDQDLMRLIEDVLRESSSRSRQG